MANVEIKNNLPAGGKNIICKNSGQPPVETPVAPGNSHLIPDYDYSDYFFSIDGTSSSGNSIIFSSKNCTHGIELIDEVIDGKNNPIIRIAPVPAFGDIYNPTLPGWKVESCIKRDPTIFPIDSRNLLRDIFIFHEFYDKNNSQLKFNITLNIIHNNILLPTITLKKGQYISYSTLGDRGFVEFKVEKIEEESNTNSAPPYKWIFETGSFQDVKITTRQRPDSISEMELTSLNHAPQDINITIQPD